MADIKPALEKLHELKEDMSVYVEQRTDMYGELLDEAFNLLNAAIDDLERPPASDVEARAIVEEIAQNTPVVVLERHWGISCFYCNGDQHDIQPPKIEIDGLYHDPDCLYVKARKLIEEGKPE